MPVGLAECKRMLRLAALRAALDAYDRAQAAAAGTPTEADVAHATAVAVGGA
jgi:hypothetical protein